MTQSLRYRAEIDGLRAVAVVPVILFHAGFSLFSGGFVGVDVFFVISGFLITGILISDIEKGQFSLARFYERRARRILPALFLVVLLCIPFAWYLMIPSQFDDFGQSIVAVVIFLSNMLFWGQSEYFAPAAELKPLLHTWSLAVEEQYYVFFPIMLAILWRFGKKTAFWVIVLCTLVSLALSEFGSRTNPNFNFYSAPTRAWELFAGSICAFVMSNRQIERNNVLSLTGLALIGFSIFGFDGNTPFPSVYTLVPVVGTALILLYGSQGTWTHRLLSVPLMTGIGLISYSAYLWHQPLFAFGRISMVGEPSEAMMLGLACVTFLLAYLSWKFVEQPFRSRDILTDQKSVFIASAVGGFVLIAIGMAIYVNQGFSNRLTPAEKIIADYANYPASKVYEMGECYISDSQTDFGADCIADKQAIIIGDSHAAALAVGLRHTLSAGMLTASQCPAVINDSALPAYPNVNCDAVNRRRIALIGKHKPEKIIIHANWKNYPSPSFYGNVRQTIRALKSASAAQIILIGGVPQFSPPVPEILLRQKIALKGEARAHTDLSKIQAVDSEIEKVAKAEGAVFVSATKAMCDASKCLIVVADNGRSYPASFDYGHLTAAGSRRLAEAMASQLD
jgi:peptidoglycan/LPS O-acetylase OafA/YrhL